MDGFDCRCVDGYYVNIYNEKLDYVTKRVSEYQTDNKSIRMYAVQGIGGKVVIQDEGNRLFVTYVGKRDGTFRLPMSTKIGEVLQVAISQMLDKPVTVEKVYRDRLF